MVDEILTVFQRRELVLAAADDQRRAGDFPEAGEHIEAIARQVVSMDHLCWNLSHTFACEFNQPAICRGTEGPGKDGFYCLSVTIL